MEFEGLDYYLVKKSQSLTPIHWSYHTRKAGFRVYLSAVTMACVAYSMFFLADISVLTKLSSTVLTYENGSR
jgi:hypothetical protein